MFHIYFKLLASSSSSSSTAVESVKQDDPGGLSSSAFENGDAAAENALQRFKDDLAEDSLDDSSRDVFRIASEKVARCPKSTSFIQYIQINAANKIVNSKLMTTSFDNFIAVPIVSSMVSGSVAGAFARLCSDIDVQTKRLHGDGNPTEPTTFCRLLVDLQESIREEKINECQSFCVGSVYSTRTHFGYTWWGCPWEYWNRFWPSAALFAAMDSIVRFVSNINHLDFLFSFISVLTKLHFLILRFPGLNI